MLRSHALPWASGIWAYLFAFAALANGVFQGVTGEVKANIGSEGPVDASTGERFRPGTTVTTGANSRAVLRLDDGHVVALHENAEFRLADYRFNHDRPQEDTFAAELVEGALCSVNAAGAVTFGAVAGIASAAGNNTGTANNH